MDSRAGTTFGKYRINRMIGKGGMGEVYEAYDTDKGRTVALKILVDEFTHDVAFRTRFQRESHAAAILQEPHVIPIHDWGEIDGSLYIDMRLVQGRTLAELLEDGPLSPPRAVDIVAQVGAALDAAHAERLIHRDVKPQNIIVTPADFAYLVDFGITEAVGDTRLTMAGSHIGTLKYMAPERFSGQPATPAVDVYALTCVLYESLTGMAPFQGDSLEKLLGAHLATSPPRPSVTNPRVPVGFDDVIARGMAKDPDDRYGSAAGLGRAAKRCLQAGNTDFAANAVTMAPQGGWPQPPRDYAPPQSASYAETAAAPPAGYQPYPSNPIPAQPYVAGPPPRQPGPPGRRRSWVVPAAIAAVAALVLGGIGIGIGLLFRGDNGGGVIAGPSLTPVTITQSRTPGESTSESSPSSTLPPKIAAPPPIVTGPDQSALHQSCDAGFTMANMAGFGTHGGRGSPETSCLFADNVLTAYWSAYGNASPDLRTVAAPGAVDCSTVPGAACSGSNFVMQCQQYPTQSWITCTGGNNARVYLW